LGGKIQHPVTSCGAATCRNAVSDGGDLAALSFHFYDNGQGAPVSRASRPKRNCGVQYHFSLSLLEMPNYDATEKKL
jgi:hypothetical protein